MYLFVEVIFYSGQRKHLPENGYRPDAVFDKSRDYWGITFIELPVEKFDEPTPAIVKFSFQDCHYQEVVPNQLFEIMEGAKQVGAGKIISIEYDIEDMFGDLHSIDIMAESKTGEIVLGLVCNGFIDGKPETQTALLDKMEGYLNHTKSEEFQEKYPNRSIILRVVFTERPDQLILDLLHKCQPWANDYGVTVEIEIGGQKEN